MTTTATPAQLYLAGLSEGSQGMCQPIDIIAGILSNGREDADSYPWQDITYRSRSRIDMET